MRDLDFLEMRPSDVADWLYDKLATNDGLGDAVVRAGVAAQILHGARVYGQTIRDAADAKQATADLAIKRAEEARDASEEELATVLASKARLESELARAEADAQRLRTMLATSAQAGRGVVRAEIEVTPAGRAHLVVTHPFGAEHEKRFAGWVAETLGSVVGAGRHAVRAEAAPEAAQ